MTHYYAARADVEEQEQRIVVSVWDDAADLPTPLPALDMLFPFESSEHVLAPAIELHDLEVKLSFAPSGPPQILRVFRGRAKLGELETYIEHVRDGTLADAVAENGPEALFLARVSAHEFVTISAWSGWDRIAAATGGNIRQPIGTRHAHLLEGGTASFYEIVPNTSSGRFQGAAAEDGIVTDRGAAETDLPSDFLARLPEPATATGS